MDDLRKKSIVELKELLNRQDNILSKTSFIAKLPDKGRKLYEVRERLTDEIRRREDGEASQCVQDNTHAAAMETLEWTGKYRLDNKDKIDSDDDDSSDETDVFKILTSQAGAGMYKKQYRHKSAEPSLIHPDDLQDSAEHLNSSSPPPEAYVDHLCHCEEAGSKNAKEFFRPYKTVIPREKSSAKNTAHHKGKNWEISAATVPDYKHGEVKPLTLTESLQLQKANVAHLKEIQEMQCSDRLAAQIEKLTLEAQSDFVPETFQVELENVPFEEEDDSQGVVNFTVSD